MEWIDMFCILFGAGCAAVIFGSLVLFILFRYGGLE